MNDVVNHRGITVGTFFGIRLRIHYSWFVIFLLVAWSVISGYLPAYYSSLSLTERLVDGMIVTILFFLSVIVHEYAHSLVAKHLNLEIHQITLFLFGGAAELQQEPRDAKTEFLITAAGPSMSILISAVFGGLWYIGRQFNLSALEIIAGLVALLNLIVAIFNLLPAYPLDGGRILRSLIWLRNKDMFKATRIATRISSVLAFAMIGLGFVEIIYGAVISGLWLGLLGYFLYQMTQSSYRQTLNQQILETVKVADIMETDIVSVPFDTTVGDYLNSYVLKYKQYDFLVSKSNDIIGIISADKLVGLSRAFKDDPVIYHMSDLNSELKLRPGDYAYKALNKMLKNKLQLLPVYSMKHLVGTVSIQCLNDYLRLNEGLVETIGQSI